jgi:hypothetical protein
MTDSAIKLQREVDKIFADAKQHAGIDQETRATRARVLDTEISRLVDGIATVGVSEALATCLRAAEAARAALSNEPVVLPVTVAEFGKCSGNGHQISSIAAPGHWDRHRLRQSASSAPCTRIGHTVCSSARRSGVVGFHYCLWPTESPCNEILNEPSNP